MRKLFITGSSGCVGHYLLDILLTQPQTEIHLLLRPSSRLKFDISQYQNVVIHHGNMDAIEELASVIAEMDYIIHIFTDWSDSEYATLLNVTKTQALFAMANPDRIKRIIYFSTASILGPGNKPIWQAEKYGPGYVRSKYQGHNELPKNPNYHKVVTVFPTLVFGGDKTHPYSHMSSGILPNLNYLKWIRFFYLDARFHFLHSKDIASVVVHLLDIPNPAKEYVLGNPVMTGKDAIRRLCKFFKIPVYFQLKIPVKAVLWLADRFRIVIGPWERYCLENPFFEYTVVNPSSFGKPTAFPTLESLLEDIVTNEQSNRTT